MLGAGSPTARCTRASASSQGGLHRVGLQLRGQPLRGGRIRRQFHSPARTLQLRLAALEAPADEARIGLRRRIEVRQANELHAGELERPDGLGADRRAHRRGVRRCPRSRSRWASIAAAARSSSQRPAMHSTVARPARPARRRRARRSPPRTPAAMRLRSSVDEPFCAVALGEAQRGQRDAVVELEQRALRHAGSRRARSPPPRCRRAAAGRAAPAASAPARCRASPPGTPAAARSAP